MSATVSKLIELEQERARVCTQLRAHQVRLIHASVALGKQLSAKDAGPSYQHLVRLSDRIAKLVSRVYYNHAELDDLIEQAMDLIDTESE